ncbi:MAG TPA: tetratricopeptide repeat protein [Rhizomicrobium sp.]|jgi:predicted O-linked N-acetylglucosamine transferase (SPINDLY family)|nr:tetratricopeptide repeat protein [Rhizomicrobium sp.]
METRDVHVLGRQAVALHQQGKPAEAERLYRQVLAIDPRVFPALYLLGVLRLEQGDSAEAAGLIERALALNPGDPAAWTHYGLALQGQARFEDALAAQERALALRPGLLAARLGRGGALRALGRNDAALADYEAVLAGDPGNADAWNGRGALLRALSRIDEALESFNRALALDPSFAEALQNRGLLLWDEKKDFPAALADLEQAVRLEPSRPALKSNLLHLKIMMALKDCDWAGADAIAQTLPALVAAGESVPPMMLLSLNGEEMLQLQAARNIVAERYPDLPPLWKGERFRHDRIRLGYISSDLGEHPVGAQIAQLIECHDRDHFDVIAFSTGPDDASALRQRLKAGFDRFHDLWGRSAQQSADFIRAQDVDVLVELNGHTQRGSLDILRRRPAPVQVSWLGYAGTSGAPFIDHLIADHTVAPNARAFSEKLEYLPNCFFVTDTTRAIGAPPSRAEAGLPENATVFCGFNHVMKLGSQSFARWMRILAQVPDSVLWLRQPEETAAVNLRLAASRHGIAPERLVFAGRVAADMHLARHALADLFLDILPYNAHATAADALWAGLPVLTCAQGCFAGRVAASLLHAVGLPELIAPTPEDYEAMAVTLARDPERLAVLKAKLAANRAGAPLFDTQRFARDIEEIYAKLARH